MKVKSESEVAQLCPTLCDPMDCSLPGSSIHGIFQARVLEWGAIAFSKVGKKGKEKERRLPHLFLSFFVIICGCLIQVSNTSKKDCDKLLWLFIFLRMLLPSVMG